MSHLIRRARNTRINIGTYGRWASAIIALLCALGALSACADKSMPISDRWDAWDLNEMDIGADTQPDVGGDAYEDASDDVEEDAPSDASWDVEPDSEVDTGDDAAPDIHVQLIWHTPGDPDETDLDGSDLDLYLMHSNAADHWNASSWVCSRVNPTPDWGETGARSHNPSFEDDDVDGEGPENIYLDHAEAGVTYTVGVREFTDRGFGPSTATVRVYLRGVLAFDDSFEAVPGGPWFIARVIWPEGEVINLRNP